MTHCACSVISVAKSMLAPNARSPSAMTAVMAFLRWGGNGRAFQAFGSSDIAGRQRMSLAAGTSRQVARSDRSARNRVLATCIAPCLALGAAAVMLPGVGWAQETYACVEEQATGFIFDKARRTWQPSVLIAERKLVLQLDQGTPRTWFVVEPRRRESSYWCPSGWINDEINCAGAMGQFWMNRKTRRFMYVYKWGYLDGDTPDTPNLTIGKCRPL